MVLRKWEDLPESMQLDEVRPYWEVLNRKKFALICKRVFDIIASSLMLIMLSPFFLILAIVIKIDSRGPVFYRQERVTQYGKVFRIHKFRSMVRDADKKGSLVTVRNDNRVTKVGRFIRKYRLDEISQLIDVLKGDMTYVGVRPEVPKYVDAYSPEMMATLLLPAGVTNLTCIFYADEAKLLNNAVNADRTYINEVLPGKMRWNLRGLLEFSPWNDIKLMFMTFFAMCGKHYEADSKAVEEKELIG